MFKHILLPTDGSKLSQIVTEKGIQFAKSMQARITGISFVMADESEAPENLKEQALEETKNLAHRHLSTLKKIAQESGVPCETVLTMSEQPYEAIVAAADSRKCDHIMMASHGRKGVKALLLGNETQKVLAHSKIPVLVYR